MSNDTDPNDRGAAATLLRLADVGQGPRLVMADLVDALGDQGFGLLLLILALPNVIPGPYIPAFSIPFALGCALLGLQLAIGERTPRLPGWIARRSVGRDGFRRFAGRAETRLLRLERLIRPRPNWLNAGPGRRVIGLTTFVLSVVLALPVPFGNMPAALAISIIALGLLQEDGIALACGVAAGFGATLWNFAVIFAGAEIWDAVIGGTL